MTTTRAPETRQEFQDGVQALVRGAESNDVDIKGGYVIQSENERHDWGIEITEVVESEKIS